MRRTFKARKLLVASIGVASISYVACTSDSGTNPPSDGGTATDGTALTDVGVVGNLVGPPADAFAGNLMPPDAGQLDAAPDATVDAATDAPADAPAEGG